MPHFVYFVSSHGFGHAARSAAVISALAERRPESRFTLFTTVPAWFFEDSLETPVEIEPVDTDLGLVQTDALTADLDATAEELRKRIPFRDATVDALARRVDEVGGDVVVSDISPLGIAVARRSGRPSVLVENFTWDWIYRGYLGACPDLAPFADYLEEVFAAADRHVQTEPVCVPAAGALQVPPVARRPRTERAEVRRLLGVPEDESLAVVTMGGIDWSYETLAADLSGEDPWLVIPGSGRYECHGRVIRLPHHSEFYHPDLIHAADAVVAKLGYSTLAEVWSAGAPLAYVTRPLFAESAKLEDWVERELECRRLETSELESRAWLVRVAELVRLPKCGRTSDGAREISRVIEAVLEP